MTQHSEAPLRLFTGTACAALDAAAQQSGMSGFDLMTRAGSAAFDHLLERWPQARRLCICAGTGNNGGDGYVVAARAAALGLQADVLQVGGRTLDGAAGDWQQRAWDAGVEIHAVERVDDRCQALLAAADVVVDALLGIGLKSAARSPTRELIEQINGSGRPVLALDVPSGLQADRTGADGPVVQATATVSFVVPKLALYSGRGVGCAGPVRDIALGVPQRLIDAVDSSRWLRSARGLWPSPAPQSYKHALGHVLVIGGDTGMFGAPLLTAEAALRSGAGLVSVITRAGAIPGFLARRPELMVRAFEDWPVAAELLPGADCIVLGPGLGRGAFGRAALTAVLEALAATGNTAALVLDADALFLLAEQPGALAGLEDASGFRTVLTPHGGEAARLLATSAERVEFDRLASARALSERFGAIALLKGPGTLVTEGSAGEAVVIGTGNPGMATAGMGDVLAGIIGARLALHVRQAEPGVRRLAAVAAAAAVHGAAADVAAERLGFRSLLAGDVIDSLGTVLEPGSAEPHHG